MEISDVRIQSQKGTIASARSNQSGFALVASLAIIPLLATAVLGVGGVFFALKKKSLAQSICIHRASVLADELGQRLAELLRLNRTVRRLNRQHRMAQRALRIAKATSFTPGIVGAELWLMEIQAERLITSLRQKAILARAELARLTHRRLLKGEVRKEFGGTARLGPTGVRALAVEARPPGALAPEYVLAHRFSRRQEQTARFTVELLPLPPIFKTYLPDPQPTECVVTLVKERNAWHPKIVRASARSSWL